MTSIAAASLERRGLFLVDCTARFRNGRVKSFGVAIAAWDKLPDEVTLGHSFDVGRGRWKRTVSKAVRVHRASFDREAKLAIYLERGMAR